MANIGKWNTPGSLATPLGTGLNSLANNTMSAASTAITNDTALDVFVDIELVLAALSPSSGAYVALYLLESVDGGTNFPAPSDADLRLQSTQLLKIIPLGVTASTAQRIVVRNVMLPPGQYKLKLDNQSGVALASSGNTVRILPYDYNLNG